MKKFINDEIQTVNTWTLIHFMFHRTRLEGHFDPVQKFRRAHLESKQIVLNIWNFGKKFCFFENFEVDQTDISARDFG